MSWIPLRSPHDREIFQLAVPALAALAADPLVSLVDTAFVGQLGAVPLAALGINTSVFSFAFVIFNFLAYGTTPILARALGRGDVERAGKVVTEALALAVIVGIAALLLLEFLAVPLLAAMGAAGEVHAPAITYLRIRAMAGPALLVITAGHGIFRGHQDTRTPLRVSLGLSTVNLVLDPLLIFGFGWGLAGAAWATVVAQWAGAVWFVYLIFGPHRAAMHVPARLPALSSLIPLLRIGATLSIRTLALIFTLTLATAVAARVGVVAVAAHQVASQIWLLLALLVDGLAISAQAMVAKDLGAGDLRSARAIAVRLLQLGVVVGLFLSLLFGISAGFLPHLFSRDDRVVQAVVAIWPFVVLMQPINALVFVWDGVFMGVEDFRYLAAAMTLAALAATVLLLLVVPLSLGLSGVWWAIVLLMFVRLATLAYRHVRWPHRSN